MITVYDLLAPILTITIAVVLGVAFNFVPAKSQKRKPIPLVAFAAIVGALGLVLSFLFNEALSGSVYSIALFQNFASIFQSVGVDMIKYNSQLVAAIVLLACLEVGLLTGFGSVFAITNMQLKRKAAKSSQDAVAADASPKIAVPATPAAMTTDILTKAWAKMMPTKSRVYVGMSRV